VQLVGKSPSRYFCFNAVVWIECDVLTHFT